MSNLIKRSFLISMVVMTAMWGVVGIVNVASVSAASAGDLVKSDTSAAVYYLDADGYKHPFHHEREYFTWYDNFDDVITITTDEMVGYTLGTTIVVRPGSRLAQYVEVLGDGTWSVANTPEVYAVGSSGALMHIDSAGTAVALYGSDWESMIVALPNYLVANYTTGDDLTSDSLYPTGTLVKTAADDQVYYIDGSTMRPVTDDGFSANHFNLDFVLTVEDLSSYTEGTSITSMEGDIANPIAGAGGTAVGTGLTVALAADNPGAQVGPLSATNVPLMKVNLTASSDGAITVNKLSFKRLGVGATADFSYIYLYEGASRLTNGKTLNSSTHVVQFVNLNYQIPAGTTKTLTLTADLASGTSGNVSYFQLTADYVDTSATVNGSFPLNSNTLTMGSSVAGTVTVVKNGTLSNPVVGQQNVKIAQFKLTAGTGENLEIHRITLYSGGAISNSYLTNLKLYQGSDLLASTDSITSNSLMVFDLSASPYSLEKNTNRIFHVTADISGSAKNTDTTKIYLENDADLYAVGQQYGYGAGVTSTSYDGNDTTCTSQSTCSDSTYLDIDGGQITVAFNGPTATTLSQGATEVTFMNFSITAGVNAEVRKMRVELHNDDGYLNGASSAGDLDKDSSPCSVDYISNVKIVDVDNGESTSAVNCSSFSDIDSADGVYYNFTDYFNLSSGETRDFAVKADLHASLDANDYYVVLGSSGTYYTTAETAYTLNTSDGVKNTDNNQWITDIVPTTHTAGNQMTVAAAGLRVSLSSNQVGTTIVQGTNNVTLAKFAMEATEGSDITITGMTISGYIDGDGSGATSSVLIRRNSVQEAGMSSSVYVYANDIVSNLKIYDITDDPSMTTNLNSTAEGLSSSAGTAAFTNMTWTIPAGETHELAVVADVANTAYTNGDSGGQGTAGMAKYVKVNFAEDTDITANDESGNSVTMLDSAGNAYTLTDANGSATAITSSSYIVIAASGTLDVTAQTTPSIANVVAGSSDVPMLNLKFKSTNEAFNVNKIQIQEIFNPSSSTRAVTSVTISYQNQAGETVTATQTEISYNANFNITSNPFYIPMNGEKIMDVYYNLETINQTYAAYTGDMVMARFDADDNFEAKGAGSSNTTLTASSNSVDVNSDVMTLHGALPTITADTTSVALAPGPAELYKWQVTASEGGRDITLKKLSFKLSMTDSVINSSTLYLQAFMVKEGLSYTGAEALTYGDNGTNHYQIYNGWGATGTTANGNGTGGKLSNASGYIYHNNEAIDDAAGAGATTTHDIIVVFNDDRLIPAGGSKYYILEATANNVDTGASSNDNISMYMYDGDTSTTDAKFLDPGCNLTGAGETIMLFTKYCLTKIANTTGQQAANQVKAWMIWSDSTGTNGNLTHTDSAVETTATSPDWFQGYKIKTLSGNTRILN